MRKLCTFKELNQAFGLSLTPQHLLRLQKARKFPLRVKFGNRNYWYVDEVQNWIDTLKRQSAPSE